MVFVCLLDASFREQPTRRVLQRHRAYTLIGSQQHSWPIGLWVERYFDLSLRVRHTDAKGVLCLRKFLRRYRVEWGPWSHPSTAVPSAHVLDLGTHTQGLDTQSRCDATTEELRVCSGSQIRYLRAETTPDPAHQWLGSAIRFKWGTSSPWPSTNDYGYGCGYVQPPNLQYVCETHPGGN